jgi:hypothetical protein
MVAFGIGVLLYKIQARSDFSKKIENDPIKLLNAIEEHALSYEETKDDMSSVSDALRQLFKFAKRTKRISSRTRYGSRLPLYRATNLQEFTVSPLGRIFGQRA